MLIGKNLEFSPEISRNPFNTFSETLQLDRTQKGRKNVPSAFLKNSRFAHFHKKKTVQNWPFWPKMPKNGGFFPIRSLEFANFLY